MTSKLPLVLLHFLGSSHREWDLVAARCRFDRRVLTLDLPGFGDAADQAPAGVGAMADRLDRFIADAGLTACIVVGHSMSAKVAAVLAARDPSYLRGLVLVTASPPSPEPMSDAGRRKLMAFDGSRGASEAYIDGITAARLPESYREIAVSDAMRTSIAAWQRWITDGSQEDCTSAVGLLTVPALVVAGEEDGSLGPSVQRDLVMPHLAAARMRVIAGGHVLPMEAPDALYGEIGAFASEVDALTGPTR